MLCSKLAAVADTTVLSPAELNTIPTAGSAVLEDHFKARVTYPNHVVGIPGITYSFIRGYRPMSLDLYFQDNAQSLKPLVIYIHGGGWVEGHSRNCACFEDFPSVLALLASKGYVVASLNYRLSSEAQYPAAVDDVKTAIKWLRSNAKSYHINKDKVIVWGASAGGQLAALAATTGDELAFEPQLSEPLKSESDSVQGAVIWYGVFDMTSMLARSPSGANSSGNPMIAFFGGKLSDIGDKVKAASPATHVGPKTPPFILIHGTADSGVPKTQSINFSNQLKANNTFVQLVLIDGANHSFVCKTPEATRAASFKALDATFSFINQIANP
jgi:acetyl esterase/lipase